MAKSKAGVTSWLWWWWCLAFCLLVASEIVRMAKDMSDAEKAELAKVFQELGERPDTKDVNSLKQWMKTYVEKSGGASSKADIKPDIKPTVANIIQDPRISMFSGDTSKDVTYDIWKYEVNSLLREHSHSLPVINRAIRKSLRGEAARVVVQLGEVVGIDEIIDRLDALYGSVESQELLLAKFYSSQQKEGESVASWACRVEELLSRASKQDEYDRRMNNDMLKAKFWAGLLQPLKDASRYKFDTVNRYSEFLKAVRSIESEVLSPKTDNVEVKVKGQVKMAQATSNSEIDELKGMVKQLFVKFDEFESSSKSQKQGFDSGSRGRGFSQRQGSGSRDRGRGINRGSFNRGGSRGRFHDKQDSHIDQSRSFHGTSGDSVDDTEAKRVDTEQKSSYDPPTCYRCGQIGHVKLGCRNLLN